ncbi:MAG: hypothetical protein JWQ90_2642 [Hydrocarboniphaga sp.]|uniref:hypothetical protein n=1 Tax=Hydrocarboniphaga sp. TaxID=2033016 RepID=UPI002635C145|nr:hypothetical protein [Hydrocarboniphaga sp.]MDB5970192.1 hypothetical protein [Hydrocarboniphaga sp.]
MILFSVLASAVAALAAYASSPNQRLWRAVPARSALLSAAVLAQCAALCGWSLALGLASGIFTALSVAMLVWVLLPGLSVLRRRLRAAA